MKVAILTITDGANYGNRLQNYALQEVLKAMGHEVEAIKRPTYRDKMGVALIEETIKICIKKCLGRKTGESYRQRKRNFARFNKNYVKFSKMSLSNNMAPKNAGELYDYFVCGSDQVWNARIRIVKEDLKNYLASFAAPEKRIAYAASFGTNDVPAEDKALFSEQLKHFKAIGLREYTGLNIVQALSGREDSTVVLDPTMLLTTNQWSSIAQKPNFFSADEPYIVTYLLGGRETAISEYINKLAKRCQCRVINLENEFISESRITEPDAYKVAPDEFVWLIQNAQCVLTDSFHATVFAILFHKPFMVFERKATEHGNNMESRIETLLGKFDLLRFHDEIDHPTKLPEMYDEENVERVLEKERKISVEFLKNALA